MLIEAVAGGDREAFRDIVERYLAPLHGLARRMTGDITLAEDIAQESFLRVWKNAKSFSRKAGSARAWISTIALNLSRDALRRRKPEQEIDENLAYDAPEPLQEMELRARELSVRRAIQDLNPRQREAVILFYDLELPQAEIATMLQTSVEAVESLLARAKKTLRVHLSPLLREDTLQEGKEA